MMIARSVSRLTNVPTLGSRAGIIAQAGHPTGATTDHPGGSVTGGTLNDRRFRGRVSITSGINIFNRCVFDAIDSPPPVTHSGLLENYSQSGTAELNQCLLYPDRAHVFYTAALKGHRIVAKSCHIFGTVDGVQLHGSGDNQIDLCHIHDGTYYTWTPPGGDGQADGQTHNDGVQILSGSNNQITRNVIERFHNACVQVTRSGGALVSASSIDDNWFDGAGFNGGTYDANPVINMTHVSAADMNFGTLRNNHYGPNGSTGGMQRHVLTNLTSFTNKTNNTYWVSGAAVNEYLY